MFNITNIRSCISRAAQTKVTWTTSSRRSSRRICKLNPSHPRMHSATVVPLHQCKWMFVRWKKRFLLVYISTLCEALQTCLLSVATKQRLGDLNVVCILSSLFLELFNWQILPKLPAYYNSKEDLAEFRKSTVKLTESRGCESFQ